MAYFAKLENNTVVQVISISNDTCGEPLLDFPETEALGQTFIADTLKLNGVWKQTSFNNNFRKQYAGIGYTYDTEGDVFVSSQPFTSWNLDSYYDWQPPTPKPEGNYVWFEPNQVWIEIVEQ
jgi:hypothetical protein